MLTDKRSWFASMVRSPTLHDVPRLFRFAFDDDYELSQEAVSVLHGLLDHLPPLQWVSLDDASRQRQWSIFPLTHPLAPSDLVRLDHVDDDLTLLYGLASFQSSGYVRQSALSRLTQSTTGDELPFLLLRLNDWVPPIAQLAKEACAQRLVSGYAAHYVNILPLVISLTRARRHDLSAFVSSVEALLCGPDGLEALVSGIQAQDQDHSVRRACARLALGKMDEPPPKVFAAALSSRDAVVRLTAARALRIRAVDTHVLQTYAPRLAVDPLAAVRREYLLLCLEKMQENTVAALRGVLLDANRSLREMGRFYLPRYERMDFRQFYRNALSTSRPSQLAAALAGLGETGRLEDANAVEAFVHHPAASVRGAAAFALGKLDAEHHTEQLLTAINDWSPRVSKAAATALGGSLSQASDETILRTLVSAQTPFGRHNMLRLISTLSKWRSGLLLLRACTTKTSHDEQTETLRSLYAWYHSRNKSFVQPSAQQRQSWQQLLEIYSGLFPPARVAELKNAL